LIVLENHLSLNFALLSSISNFHFQSVHFSQPVFCHISSAFFQAFVISFASCHLLLLNSFAFSHHNSLALHQTISAISSASKDK